MNTVHNTQEEKMEHFDSGTDLDQKITSLAEWIKNSKHFTVFTGAGISTSAGIPDYRSGVNTVLPTGPGAWEKVANNINTESSIEISMISAIPTFCHMALVKLMQAGYLKFVISQNVDGLHRKSGIPAKKIAELHGNSNVEICKNRICNRRYLRDFKVRTAQKPHEHNTGRKCENCGQNLYDNIVNFEENLPSWELDAGFEESMKADLCLTLGSSLKVSPAVEMPMETVKRGGRLVIVNLQSTPLDEKGFRINGLIDDVMGRLMNKLGLVAPNFTLKRRVMISKSDIDSAGISEKGRVRLIVKGVDEEGNPYSLFKSMKILFVESNETVFKDKEPVIVCPEKSDIEKGIVRLKLEFQGHYGEPEMDLEVELDTLKLNEHLYYLLEFDIQQKKWISWKPITL